MAAPAACNFAGSTTVGLSGQMIKIASGASRLDGVMINRLALVTRPEANSIGDDMETVTSPVIQVPGEAANARGRPAGLVAACRRDGGPKLAGRLTRPGSVRLAAVVSSAQRRAERLHAS